MIELTRRWFLFGSAAAVTMAAAGIKAETPFAPVVEAPTPSLMPYRWRKINELCVFPTIIDPSRDLAVECKVSVGSDRVLYHATLNQRGILRWFAHPHMPEAQWVVPADQALRVELSSDAGRIMLGCRDKVDDGPPVELLETWDFPLKGPAEIVYMHADNSLEARLEREGYRENAAKYDALDDFDEPDLWEDYEEDDHL